MKIPYGIADFHRIRAEGYLYVDRTDRIRTVEEAGDALLFLRPRRFGKSLWLGTLASYYDLRNAAEHERLFGGLAMGAAPTPLAHRYFVLVWDFSNIDPEPPLRGKNAGVESRIRRIGNELHGYLNTSLETFLADYRGELPEIAFRTTPSTTSTGCLPRSARRPTVSISWLTSTITSPTR